MIFENVIFKEVFIIPLVVFGNLLVAEFSQQQQAQMERLLVVSFHPNSNQICPIQDKKPNGPYEREKNKWPNSDSGSIPVMNPYKVFSNETCLCRNLFWPFCGTLAFQSQNMTIFRNIADQKHFHQF